MKRFREYLVRDRALAFLLGAFLLLGVVYSVTTPLFEAGDELWHYPYVAHLARGGGLPIQDPSQKQLWEQEGGQPPLYYLISAALTFWIDSSDLEARLWRNPYAKIGIPLAYGSKNMVIHTSAESFPWSKTTLAVHLIRLFSLLLSAGTVALTYYIAKELLISHPNEKANPATSVHTAKTSATLPPLVMTTPGTVEPSVIALLCAAVVTFNPMFLFISGSVNNDSLAALLATVVLYLVVQLATKGMTNRRLLFVGVALGFAILTKISNLALFGLALVVISWLSWRRRDLQLFLRGVGLIALPALLIASWWYFRNALLYGDPLGLNVWLQISGGRAPQTLLGLLNEFQGLRISFWGNFGGVNLIAPEWVYLVLDVFLVLAVVGLVLGAFRRMLPHLLWIPALYFALVFAALVRWSLLTYASQGRLLFPAIAAIAILFVVGLYSLGGLLAQFINAVIPMPRQPFTVSRNQSVTPSTRSPLSFIPDWLRRRSGALSSLLLPFLAVLFLLFFALLAPFLIIAPAYAQPERLAEDAAVPNPVHIRFDAASARPELVGFDAGRFVEPGEELPITLYWKTDAPIEEDLYVYIHLYDAQNNLIGQWDALPGNGMYPTRVWQPGEIIVDNYRVPIIRPPVEPPVGRVEVGLSREGSTVPLAARDPRGQEITPTLTLFRYLTAPAIPNATKSLFSFGEVLGLTSIELTADDARGQHRLDLEPNAASIIRPGKLLATLDLTARAQPEVDYVVFAQLVDRGGNIIAQYDSQPMHGTFPTSLWQKGDHVRYSIELTPPPTAAPGYHSLLIGVYGAAGGTRLPVSGGPVGNIKSSGDHIEVPIRVE